MIVILVFAVLIPPSIVLAAAAVMRVGARHEGWQGSLHPDPPTVAAAVARMITGLYVRLPTAGRRRDSLTG